MDTQRSPETPMDEWAERRTALLARLAGADPDRIVAELAADSAVAISRLGPATWRELLPRVRDAAGRLPAPVAWRCAASLMWNGEHHEAAGIVESAATLGADPADLAQLDGIRASLSYYRGDEPGCAAAAERAMALAEESGDEGALGVAWTSRALHQAIRGDRAGNAESYARALEHARSAGDLLLEARVTSNLVSAAEEQGDYPAAIAWVDRGLPLVAQIGDPSRTALLRLNLSAALLGLGRLDEALLEVDLAHQLWSSVGSGWAAAALELRGRIQTARGNLQLATPAFRESIAAAEPEADSQTLVPALGGLARVLVSEDPAEAAAVVERLLAMPAALGHVESHLSAGWVALHREDHEAARSQARAALAEAGTRNHRAGRAEALVLDALAGGDPTGLLAAAAFWQELGNPLQQTTVDLVRAHLGHDVLGRLAARDELRQLGVHHDAWRAAGPLNAVRRALPDLELRVHTLGAFVLYRDGVAVGPTEWPAAEVADLLRDLVIEGKVRTEPALVRSLRTVLDPSGSRPEEYFVALDGDIASLDPDHVHLDVTAFLSAARLGLAAAEAAHPDALRMLRLAASLHTGDFLGGCDSPGAVALRSEVHILGLRVIRALADLHAAGPNPLEAVPWLARLLVIDPLDESVRALLLRLLHDAGEGPAMRRYHDAYVLRCRSVGRPALSLDALLALPGDSG